MSHLFQCCKRAMLLPLNILFPELTIVTHLGCCLYVMIYSTMYDITPMKDLKLVYVPHEICFTELNIINQSMVRLIIKNRE